MSEETDDVARPTAHYAPAEPSPAEFEQFVTSLFDALAGNGLIEHLRIQTHEVVRGVDGVYDFDATVRYRLTGMDFLVLVEAKRHKNPIKRELVQVLHDKLRSVGAQKAVLVSTAPFQKGALDYALAHGIALVTVTEGRFTFQTRSADAAPSLSRELAAELGLPPLVGYAYSPGDVPGSVRSTIISREYPEYLAEELLPEPGGGSSAPASGALVGSVSGLEPGPYASPDLAEAMLEHLAEPFPTSVAKGVDYGEVDPVMVEADVYGWALRVSRGERLTSEELMRLARVADDLARSMASFPAAARGYFLGVERLARLAVAHVRRDLGQPEPSAAPDLQRGS